MSLIIENLNLSYGHSRVLKNINLKIESGEFISLLGVSGSGKTSLLKSIAGLVEPNTGRITLNGKDLSQVPAHKRRISYVFQDLRLFPHLSVYDNIAFPLKMNKVDKKTWPDRIQSLLEEVHMAEYIDRGIHELSGGQQQRIALARALAIQPELLLLDEPFSGLDEYLRQEMGDLIQDLHQNNNLSIIMVTHDKDEAIRYSSQIALLHDGSIHQEGSASELIKRPKDLYVAQFFGDCNLVDGQIKNNTFSSSIGSWPCMNNLEDGPYIAMFRPSEGELIANPNQEETDKLFFPVQINNLNLFSEKIQLGLEHPAKNHQWTLLMMNHRKNREKNWMKGSFYLVINKDALCYFPKKT